VDDWAKAGPVVARGGGTVAAGGAVSLEPPADIAGLVAALVGEGVRVRAVVPLEQTLEQIYLEKIAQP
jgi:hypothetical protein